MKVASRKNNKKAFNAVIKTKAEDAGKKVPKKAEKYIIAFIAAVIPVLLFSAYCLISDSEVYERMRPAVTVGTEKISIAEYNYNYYSTIGSYLDTMENYGYSTSDLGFDMVIPFDLQLYTNGEEGETWADYFKDRTNDYLKNQVALCLEAETEGIALPDAELEKLETQIDTLRDYCGTINTALDTYLSETYGRGVNESVLRQALSRSYLADYYINLKNSQATFTDDELNTYYEENKDDIDLVDFRAFSFYSTAATDADESATDEALIKADEMFAYVTDEASFKQFAIESVDEAARETYESSDLTIETGVSASTLDDDMKSWLFDADRSAGDKTVIETDSGYTVLYFLKRYRGEYSTVDVRQIFLQTQDSTDEAAAEENEEVKSKAEEIYNEWLNGDKTEASFSALAEKYSEDTGSNGNGGLYSKIQKNEELTEFNDWCFDSSRKPGDCDIINTSYGYHIVYFVGLDDPVWIAAAKDGLLTEEYQIILDQAVSKYALYINDSALDKVGKR